MKKLVPAFALLMLFLCPSMRGQDTLPEFSVRSVGNKRIIVEWVNKFETIKQISIQRSFDSLQGYRTILTVADPKATLNGFVDSKAANDHMFYRLYILLDKGVYLFSSAKKPFLDTLKKSAYSDKSLQVTIDSVGLPNLGFNNGKSKPEVFVPSLHVYTNKDGYVKVSLPEELEKKYSIKFFEDDGTFLFELKDLKERTFKLDKSNFHHGGWFHFELYENDKLTEKHKFYLQKDF